MSILLDSASVADARAALSLGFIAGITTNPNLMAQVEGRPEDIIAQLADLCPGPVYYQLNAPTLAEREREARQFVALRPNVGLKIPMTFDNLELAARLTREGIKVGMTASYGAAQTLLTAAANIHYSIAYVNRSTRLQGDGLMLVRSMRAVIDATDTATTLLVASLKTPTEVVAALTAGAHDLTLPLALLREMGDHSLSEATIAEFGRVGD